MSDKEIIEAANKTVDKYFELLRKGQGKGYRNRERIPEPLLPYADIYHWLTGQTPSPRTLSDWIQELWYWQGEGLHTGHIVAAYWQLTNNDILVVRPGSLTNTAVALMGVNDWEQKAVWFVDERYREYSMNNNSDMEFDDWLSLSQNRPIWSVYGIEGEE